MSTKNLHLQLVQGLISASPSSMPYILPGDRGYNSYAARQIKSIIDVEAEKAGIPGFSEETIRSWLYKGMPDSVYLLLYKINETQK